MINEITLQFIGSCDEGIITAIDGMDSGDLDHITYDFAFTSATNSNKEKAVTLTHTKLLCKAQQLDFAKYLVPVVFTGLPASTYTKIASATEVHDIRVYLTTGGVLDKDTLMCVWDEQILCKLANRLSDVQTTAFCDWLKIQNCF